MLTGTGDLTRWVQSGSWTMLRVDVDGRLQFWSPSSGNRYVIVDAYEVNTGEDALRSNDWLSATGMEIRGKNGMSSFKIYGRKTTTGAPTTGTWPTGAVVMDSASPPRFWYCSSGGSPGTWV